jgi:hypothetical protein
MPMLRLTTEAAILGCSNNAALRSALSLAGSTPAMQAAQRQVATERYLQPAIDACDGSNFTLPLSLAVIYDSINHGSFEHIRDSVVIDRSEHPNSQDFERAWITDYVNSRDHWLASVPRLASDAISHQAFLKSDQCRQLAA